MGLFSRSENSGHSRSSPPQTSPRTIQRQGTASSTNGSSMFGSRRIQLTDAPSRKASSHVGRTSSYKKPPSKASSSNSHGSRRPMPLARTPSVQTRYMEMLLHLDQIPRLHNILAAFFTWVLLAGFIVLPGTFTSLQKAQSKANSDLEKKILDKVANLPLLWVAGVCVVVGAAGMIGLWIRWRRNYVWLINRVWLPGLLNSLAGIISTIVNVYTARNGQWSLTAKVTAIVIGGCLVVTMILFGLYNHWILARVRKSHERQLVMEPENESETVGEKVNRIANKPALEPGSVV